MLQKFFSIFALTLVLAAAAGRADAQVLVYKLEFSGGKGVNFHTFEGGFVIVPLLGGDASFLLTSTEDGKSFSRSDGGGKFFVAVTNGGDQKAVLSSPTGSGTASGFMVGFGDVNHVVKVNSRTVSLAMRVAKSLHGTIVSADDESTAEASATDGSLGSAGVAEFKMVLDEDQTNTANKNSRSIDLTITEQLIPELERQGFSEAEDSTDDGTDDTTDDTTNQ